MLQDGVDGECESVYVFQGPHEHSVAPENDDQQVSKIRNYDNCLSRPAHKNGPFSIYVVDQENPQNVRTCLFYVTNSISMCAVSYAFG